jgi:23S rRNA pseudouridine2605 synthase
VNIRTFVGYIRKAMENNNEDTSTYRPRTGSLERRKTAAAPKRAAKSADEEESPRPKREVRKEKDADEAPVKRSSTRQSFFKNRTPTAEREDSFEEKPKRAPRKSYGEEEKPRRAPRKAYDDEEKPKRRQYAGDNEKFAPRRKYGNEEERPNRRSGFDDFRREKPRTERRGSSSREERDERPFARKPHGEKPFARKSYGDDKPYERKPYGRKPFGEASAADAGRPRRSFEDKPRRDIRVLEPKPKVVAQDPDKPVRLNKFIANSGVSSRREADEYIQNGEVTVNGQVVTELGTKVMITDDIRWNGEKLSGEKKVYVLLNKPKGYVTTVDDPHADKTVMDLIAGACKERVYPVGRLDKNTTGVLLFTNDGDLTKVLTHPSYNKRKVYQVSLDKTLKKPDMDKLVQGVELEDGVAVADEVGYTDMEDKSEVGLEIHSGRNRVVRRMFEALGYEVQKLDRVYFAGLTKKSLERGKWRILTPKEVSMLKMGAYE